MRMPSPPRPLALILDMDGTLLDTEPLAARAWYDAAAAIGVAFDPSLAHRMIGRTFADCRALVVERHGSDYPTDRLMSRWHAAYDAIVERDGLVLKPGPQEPWTPFRMTQAFIQAGVPRQAISIYPGLGDVGKAVVDSCPRTLIFGSTATVEQ